MSDDHHLDKEMPFFTGVTVRQVLAEACPVCKATPGESCQPVGGYTTGTHKARIWTVMGVLDALEEGGVALTDSDNVLGLVGFGFAQKKPSRPLPRA
jgi:hypothetical protein